MGLNFTSIQNSEEFKGYENDLDRYAPPKESNEETHINKYGVRVRGKRKDPNHDEGNDAVVFSTNKG